MTQAYFPFRGYSAWFSSSVHPSVVRKWGEFYQELCCLQTVPAEPPSSPLADQFGGLLDSEDKAQLLFSDDAHAKDTVRCVPCYWSHGFVNGAWERC